MKFLINKYLLISLLLWLGTSFNPIWGQDAFFKDADVFLKKHVKNGLIDYTTVVKNQAQLAQLVKSLEDFDLSDATDNHSKAFWINAYNLLCIQKVATHYPTPSPLQINSFFEQRDLQVAGQRMSLNQLEKEKLFAQFKDPRIHFVLVCAAIDCPKIKNGAFFPEELDEQIDKSVQAVLNDPEFIRIDRSNGIIELSAIFRWYATDFEEGEGLRHFINQHRKVALPKTFKIKYYDYDWALNDVKNDRVTPFRASALLHPGITEIKIFNALYTQTTFDGFENTNSRSSYFSSFTQVLYGWKNNLNIGFDLVYKSNVVNDFHNASPFKTLGFKNAWTYQSFDCNSDSHNISPLSLCEDDMPSAFDTLRNAAGEALQTHQSIGLSHFGPKFKINPIKKWTSLSLQQTLFIPINKSVDGSMVSFTQLFYDKPIGSRTQVFVEGSLWTTITPQFKPLPFVKVFYSYFPTKKWTLYGMTSNLIEYGAGAKVFILPKLELEILYTYYLPIETFMQDRRAMTFNFGIRYQG